MLMSQCTVVDDSEHTWERHQRVLLRHVQVALVVHDVADRRQRRRPEVAQALRTSLVLSTALFSARAWRAACSGRALP